MEIGLNHTTEDEIEEYLREHPDFFADKDFLLRKMTVPHNSGIAISLLEKQNQLLRDETDRTSGRLHRLITHARDNDRMFSRLKTLILDLMMVTSVPELARCLNHHLTQHFTVDGFRLLTDAPVSGENPLIAALPEPAVLGHHDELLSTQKTTCGRFTEDMRRALLGDGTRCLSMALSSAYYEKTRGILVLGSEKEEHFSNSMDTIFLNYLSEATARIMSRL